MSAEVQLDWDFLRVKNTQEEMRSHSFLLTLLHFILN